MMPHEVNAIIAKVIFVLSAACVLTMAKVRAHDLPTQTLQVVTTNTSK